MAKDDYFFKLMYKRLLTSTIGWKDDEFGAYLRLLIHQFDNNNSIPNDLDELVLIAPSIKKNWKRISKKFKENAEGNLFNEVMSDVWHEAQKQKNISRKNGQNGGRPKTQQVLKTDEIKTRNEPGGFDVGFEKKPETINNKQDTLNNKEEKEIKRNSADRENEEKFYPDKSMLGIDLQQDDLDLTITYLESVCYKEFQDPLLKNQWLSKAEIIRQWKWFKIKYFTGEKPYDNWSDLINHFRDLLKGKIQKSVENPTAFTETETSVITPVMKQIYESRKREDELNGNH